MNVRFAAAHCTWKKRTTADSGYDLSLRHVELHECLEGVVDGVQQPVGLDGDENVIVCLDLLAEPGPRVKFMAGYLPGALITSNYDLRSKIDRLKDHVLGQVVQTLAGVRATTEDK